MEKTIKFNKIGIKRRFIQYIVIILISIFVLFIASKLIEERRRSKIRIYNSQIKELQNEKQRKIDLIEKEYNDKIEALLNKIDKINE
ncbi:hypothetical protein [uncultured Ilyobacter sp.]|jgi:uncharacterized membrane protein|uniref:hypothetical protein n=1 Tax=uncultured Ilyobacter sp. TaxID=544433 RepID=UPI0029C0C28B|nr:hypothetical protein [uncultured Ilyobacter sp.]